MAGHVSARAWPWLDPRVGTWRCQLRVGIADACEQLQSVVALDLVVTLDISPHVEKGARCAGRNSLPWCRHGISVAGHCGDARVARSFCARRTSWSSANSRSARYCGCEPAQGEDALKPPWQRASRTTRESPDVSMRAQWRWLCSSVLHAGSMSPWRGGLWERFCPI